VIGFGEPSLVPLERASAVAGCGGKASSLARLMKLGLRVPQGFVVTGAEYARHLASCGATAGLEPAEIRRRIVATALAPELRSHLAKRAAGMRWPLAVRSSAAAEDSRGASFAGQLDSLLGVEGPEGLEEAIRVVWASAWSDRCLKYAEQKGVGAGAVAVIVQEQVDARFSGVLFTRDPLGGAQAAVIECVEGLGDRLVGGEVNPGRLRVDAGGAVTRLAPTGLSDAAARELAAIGAGLERALGAPQDIEWSIDRVGRVILLQSRPVTAGARRRHVWSNANIAENFPDPVTPFLFSIVSRGYTAYFTHLGLGFGLSRRRIAAMEKSLAELVGLHAGRLYYNLTNIHAALGLAPGGARLAGWFNDFTGACERPETQVPPVTFAQRCIEPFSIAAAVAWKYATLGRRVARFERRVDAFAEGTRPADLAGRDAQELARDLEGFLDIRLARWNDAALADAAAMVCYGVLGRMLARVANEGTAASQNDLLKGLPGLASAAPVTELWKLSREVRADDRLRELFAGHSAEEVLRRLEAPELAAFRARFDGYLERWGFRYSRELMLTSATPRENPAPMVALLQSYLLSEGRGPEAIAQEQARSRLEATEALLRGLPWPRAVPLAIVLRATQGAIRLRERARMKQALLYTRLRHIALRIGEVLVERGALEVREDVFFLKVDEVREILRPPPRPKAEGETHLPPPWVGEGVIVARRRAEFAAFATLQPPDSITLETGKQWQPPATPAPIAIDESALLHGTSACGGETSGTAHVIEDVAGIGAFRAGEILVTRQTDPGWAAVFFMAKGLVIERGGMLSHGAIIAREYGIPAVVGVEGATRRIRNGEQVRVDGDHGVVELAAR
jgi:rifampicin phosphotransferase